jgi:hypothetical protein
MKLKKLMFKVKTNEPSQSLHTSGYPFPVPVAQMVRTREALWKAFKCVSFWLWKPGGARKGRSDEYMGYPLFSGGEERTDATFF